MYKSLIIAAFAAFSTANLLGRQADCTKTLPSSACCPAVAGHTVTSYTDCAGCALETQHNTFCDIVRCSYPPATKPSVTSTFTSCAPTPTPYLTTVTSSACTSTITEVVPPCGNCGVTYDQTATVNVDCKGCALATTTSVEEGMGICVCPTDTAMTIVTDCIAIPTAY